jgi:hypothetical protein
VIKKLFFICWLLHIQDNEAVDIKLILDITFLGFDAPLNKPAPRLPAVNLTKALGMQERGDTKFETVIPSLIK